MSIEKKIENETRNHRITAYVSKTSDEVRKKLRSHDRKERHDVITLWNQGKSCEDIASELRIQLYKVEYYIKRFVVIYGEVAVREREIPYEVPLDKKWRRE